MVKKVTKKPLVKKTIKKKSNKLKSKLSKFVPRDDNGDIKFKQCCKNKSQYICKFPGAPLTLVCKSHIKDESLMEGVEMIIDVKSSKEIPLENMGFEKPSPTLEETLEKTKRENSVIFETESICVSGIAIGNRFIKLYQRFIDEDEHKFGKDSTSYKFWIISKETQEMHVSDLCKILINCSSKTS